MLPLSMQRPRRHILLHPNTKRVDEVNRMGSNYILEYALGAVHWEDHKVDRIHTMMDSFHRGGRQQDIERDAEVESLPHLPIKVHWRMLGREDYWPILLLSMHNHLPTIACYSVQRHCLTMEKLPCDLEEHVMDKGRMERGTPAKAEDRLDVVNILTQGRADNFVDCSRPYCRASCRVANQYHGQEHCGMEFD